MSERPFMQLYVSDFIGDTLHLSTEQIGAYMLLLMAMWNADGSLPDDEAKLARVSRMSVKKWRSISDDLMQFFDAVDGAIRHNRLTRELQKSESKSQSRASAGARGGTAKALKDKEAHLANASVLPQHLPDTIKVKEEPDGSSKKRATRLSQDWVLPSEWHDEAVQKGMHPARVLAEAERMRNWSLSNKNGAKLDWRATWRNWYSDKLPGNLHGTSPPQKITQANMWKQEAEDLGIIENDTSSSARLLGEGFQGISSESSAFARRFAIAGSR